MPSAYKSMERQSDELAFDSDVEQYDESSDASTKTLSDESESRVSHLKSLPIELKSRVLMLSTRGISHRYEAPYISPEIVLI